MVWPTPRKFYHITIEENKNDSTWQSEEGDDNQITIFAIVILLLLLTTVTTRLQLTPEQVRKSDTIAFLYQIDLSQLSAQASQWS